MMTQNVYNKHNTSWKVLRRVFTHSLFLYQKSNELAQRIECDDECCISCVCIYVITVTSNGP